MMIQFGVHSKSNFETTLGCVCMWALYRIEFSVHLRDGSCVNKLLHVAWKWWSQAHLRLLAFHQQKWVRTILNNHCTQMWQRLELGGGCLPPMVSLKVKESIWWLIIINALFFLPWVKYVCWLLPMRKKRADKRGVLLIVKKIIGIY